MTMTEDEKIDAADVVNLEAIYGSELLVEIATVTELLEIMKPELRPLMVRATGVARAVEAAEDRVVLPEGSRQAHDGWHPLLNLLSGMEAFETLTMQVGIFESVFEASEPGECPIPDQFVPGFFRAGDVEDERARNVARGEDES